jgi:hypothetical protein
MPRRLQGDSHRVRAFRRKPLATTTLRGDIASVTTLSKGLQ